MQYGTERRKMKLTIKTTTEINPEELKEKVRSGALKAGDELEIKGALWRILAAEPGRAVIWKHTNCEYHVFNEDGSNKYEGSDIQNYLKEADKELLGEEIAMMLTGNLQLLSYEEVMQWLPTEPERIITNKENETWYWWLRSPNPSGCYNVHNVRVVNSSGALNHINADIAFGAVAPMGIIMS